MPYDRPEAAGDALVFAFAADLAIIARRRAKVFALVMMFLAF